MVFRLETQNRKIQATESFHVGKAVNAKFKSAHIFRCSFRGESEAGGCSSEKKDE